MFLHLLALRDGGSESFDAGHVRYPLSSAVVPMPPGLLLMFSDVSAPMARISAKAGWGIFSSYSHSE